MDFFEHQRLEQERWKNRPGRLAKVLMALGARTTGTGLFMFFLIPICTFAGIGYGLFGVVFGAVFGWALALGIGRLIGFCSWLRYYGMSSGVSRVKRKIQSDPDEELRKLLFRDRPDKR
jgi:hypothetical protein